MDTRIRPRPEPPSGLGADSRYARVWNGAALLTGAVWVVIAVLQTPRLPLVLLVGGLAAAGGTLFVHAPVSTSRGRRQYAAGALAVAGLVLVTVGVGHHLVAGLTVATLLAGSSPALIRWVAKG